ncbi:MAG: polysaccharide pyruvyl transferase CsaB [Limnochordia bacterium]|nr:polysaccharide pyruvyl transferase CsaB [Limnochordia bacterium]
MSKVILAGYYGYDNTGDEAIVSVLASSLKNDDRIQRVTVLSQHPHATAKEHEVHSIFRYDLPRVLQVLRQGDALVLSGGLMQDVTSSRSLWYYLTLTRLGLKLGCKVYWHAMGIGPVQSPHNRRRLMRLANRLTGLSVRDHYSASFLPGAKLVPDPALLLDAAPAGRIQRIFRMLGEPYGKGTVLGIALRPWGGFPGKIEQVAYLADELARRFDAKILFLPLHFEQDLPLIQDVIELMKEEALCLGLPIPPGDMAGVIQSCDLVISMRLHALIFAAVCGTSFVALETDPKIGAFAALTDEKALSCTDEQFPVASIIEDVAVKLPRSRRYDRDRRQLVLELQSQSRSGLEELIEDICR